MSLKTVELTSDYTRAICWLDSFWGGAVCRSPYRMLWSQSPLRSNCSRDQGDREIITLFSSTYTLGK